MMFLSHLIDLLLLGQNDFQRLGVPKERLAPLGQAAGSLVRLSDPDGVERLAVVDSESSDSIKDVLRNVILRVGLELFKELDISHGLLCHWPVRLLVAEVQKDALEGEKHVLRRLLRLLQVRNVVLA